MTQSIAPTADVVRSRAAPSAGSRHDGWSRRASLPSSRVRTYPSDAVALTINRLCANTSTFQSPAQRLPYDTASVCEQTTADARSAFTTG